MKKLIIFIFMINFIFFSFLPLFSNLRSYSQVNFLSNEVLSDQLFKLIDCYFANYGCNEENFEQLRELDNSFKYKFGFSTIYSFLQKKSLKVVKILIFWRLNLNMTEYEHEICKDFSQNDIGFKSLYAWCLNNDNIINKEQVLKICFFIILQNKRYDLFNKYSAYLDENVAENLLQELRSLSSAFIKDEGYQEAYEFLKESTQQRYSRCQIL